MSVNTNTVLDDVENSEIGILLADRARCRVLVALNDGRALPASVLADEAGVPRATANSHLAKLTDAGLLHAQTHGRHRYYRLAGPRVGELREKLTQMAPTPVNSLRDGTRAAQLRAARTCYDHLAGRLGVAVMASMLQHDHLTGGDGVFRSERAERDRVSGYGRDIKYSLTPSGWRLLDVVGVRIPPGNRALVRYCVDWTEQRHHLAGALGRAVLDRFLEARWVRRHPTMRSLRVTPLGRTALNERFSLAWG
jgi:DNA-binding transcriptional ArsR family regulator